MDVKIIFKDEFSVIGKKGQGLSSESKKWIPEIWEAANGNFNQIQSSVKYDQSGIIYGLWGLMSSIDESFNRWEESGMYLAGCEADADTQVPEHWSKWTIPAQTYLVATCSSQSYGETFAEVVNEFIPKQHINIVGAVHEHYPQPGNIDLIELYFPIAKGNCFCQSCGMPMLQTQDHGTQKDESKSTDYCHYCYQNGAFTKDETMEQMIESCIPFEIKAGVYEDAEAARKEMLEYFPKMKRWGNSGTK